MVSSHSFALCLIAAAMTSTTAFTTRTTTTTTPFVSSIHHNNYNHNINNKKNSMLFVASNVGGIGFDGRNTGGRTLTTIGNHPLLNEEEAHWILNQARQVAYSDVMNDGNENDNIQTIEWLLQEMIHLQSGCVTGTLVGNDICNDQDTAADIVAHLRQKLEYLQQMEHYKHPNQSPPSSSMVPMIATELSLGALFMVFAVFWTTMDMSLRLGDDFVAPESIFDWWATFCQMGYISFL